MNKRKIFRRIGIFVIICITLELVLRYGLGFCDALLYQKSKEYEYIAQPNQDRCRFGAEIHYNSFSQRCEEPDSAKTKVLGLGDSVIFGGTWMDQDSLATTLFTLETGMQMLNISCGSWGPDNCAAYIKKHGAFGAKVMVLVCSSHDAYDVVSHEEVVGIMPNYPDEQYSLAIAELVDRYAWPRICSLFKKVSEKVDPDAAVVASAGKASVAKKTAEFNPGFDELKAIADSLQIPFAIYLHAELGELERQEYNEMGGEILRWANNNDVPVMQGMKYGERKEMYRDVIHLNEKGQRHLAECLKKIVKELMIKG